MGRPPCCWDDKTFANWGDVTYGTALLAQWDPAYIRLAPVVHVSSAAMIDAAIAGDAGVESVRCRKTVYVPAPYVGLLLSSDLTLVKAWQFLRRAIVNAMAEDACQPIVD